MTSNSAQEFVKAVSQDKTLLSKVQQLQGNISGILDVARQAGYEITAEAFLAAMTDSWTQNLSELTEMDLDAVAGGGGKTTNAADKCYYTTSQDTYNDCGFGGDLGGVGDTTGYTATSKGNNDKFGKDY